MTLETTCKYFATIRHLRFSQLFWLCLRKLRKPTLPLLATLPERADAAGTWVCPPCMPPSLSHTHLTLLHRSQALDALGKPWYVPAYDALWNYHLHYFEDLLAENAADRLVLHQQLIARWIHENPPIQGKGWDPYPLSRRMSYWIMASQSSPTLLNTQALASLALQAEHLRHTLEYHLQGNHLFANAKALVLAGLFFSGDAAAVWRKKGEALLKRELRRQFGQDGAHEEGSPMYHALMVQDMLDMVNCYQRYNQAAPELLLETLPETLGYLRHVSHPDGGVALFNDAALNIAPATPALLTYAATLGFYPVPIHSHTILRLETGAWVVLFDAGEIGAHHQPGHAHADNLTFEVSWHGERFIVNTGTSQYGNTARRNHERSTAAHNTLVVDGKNSSNVWHNFRVGQRARPFSAPTLTTNTQGMVCAEGSHDGYAPLIHRRRLTVTPESMVIEDFLEGSGTHDIMLAVHFAPGVRVEDHIIITPQGKKLRLELPAPFTLAPYDYAPEFGDTQPAIKVEMTLQKRSIPHVFKTRLSVLTHC